MLFSFLTFLVAFMFMLGMIIILFLLIRDFGDSRKRMINLALLVLATAIFAYIMTISWGSTWVGAPPY